MADAKHDNGSATPSEPDGSMRSRDSSSGKKTKKQPRSKQKAALKAAKRKGRAEIVQKDGDFTLQLAGADPADPPPMQQAIGTGLLYDDALKAHHCPIGSKHGNSECAERLSICMKALENEGLAERCVRVNTRPITDEEILSLHSSEYLEAMKRSSDLPPDELQQFAERYDSIFLCNRSFELGRLATGGLLDLTEKVVKGQLRNGFAVTRPPGHHAQCDRANGYSLLNNVALAAKMARTKWDVERVLIVDWDVHHGQGVQYMWEDDPSVLYFSMHRYENQEFWPHLPESNYDHIGRGSGTGYNINIPWNKVGMSDAEYLTTFHHLLLPIAYEFNPRLVLVCAGFDSALGDSKGEMKVTPSCFAHLTHKLMSLAGGKVVLCLEGGYSLQSLGESVARCTGALLGDECPPLSPLPRVCDSAKETLHHVIGALKPHWKSLQCGIPSAEDEDLIQSGDVSSTTPDEHPPQGGGRGDADADPATGVSAVGDRLQKELRLSRPPHRTGLLYDERMKLHKAFNHPERPERIARIFAEHKEHGLLDRCHRIQARQATEEELAVCHLPSMIAEIKETGRYTARELTEMQGKFNPVQNSRDVYLHPDSYLSATVAVGSCLNLVDAVLTNKVLNGVGIVRPPGHHADCKMASGFCFFNNVSIASKYAQNKYGVKRILIVDWDVHHGNGTQRLLESDPSVMYISLHRYEDGCFYPPGPEGAADRVGKGKGIGYNVNVGWNTGNRGGVGDAEYMAAFHHVVMPLAYQFQPELVFISAGFDAAKGDPLGACLVSPECYGHMTSMLNCLAGGHVITVLEGGYNLHSNAVSMAMCTRSLLGDALPDLSPGIPSRCGIQAIYDVAQAHSKFWPCMETLVGFLETMVYKQASSENQPPPEAEPVTSVGTPESLDNSSSGPPPRSNADEVSSTRVESTGDDAINASQRGENDGGGDSEVAARAEGDDGAVMGISEAMSRMSVRQRDDHEGGGEEVGIGDGLDDSNGAVAGASARMKAADDAETLGACGFSDAHAGLKVGDLIGGLGQAFGSEVEMHAVIPMPWCPHLETGVRPLPPSGLDTSIPCQDCGGSSENWVCLQCYQVYCGRYVNEHMLMHGLATGHLLVLSYADLSVWCYGCDAYVHNEIVIPAKRAAHLSKFGEDVPGM